MAWTEQPDGPWTRPLDCHDRLFQFTSDQGKPLNREHWLLVGTVRMELPPTKLDPAEELCQAWKRLRLQHPDIALELTEAREKRYLPVSSPEALNAWCDATFRIETDVLSADHLFTDRLRRAAPQATCHWVPASGELVLVSQHWRWDGCGLLMMLHELLAQLEQPTPTPELDGREAGRLVPSLDVVLGMPDTKPIWEKQAGEMLAPFLSGMPSIGLREPGRTDTPAPAKTIRVEHVVSSSLTASLRRAARSQHQITVTSAVHAAAIAATVRANPSSPPATRFTSWAMFDLRKHCPPPFDGPLHAPSLRTLGIPISLDAHAAWPDLAHALQAVYHQPWTPPASDLVFVRVPLVDKALEMLAQDHQDMPPPSEPSISSLGILDRYVRSRYAGNIKVTNVSVAVHQLSQQLQKNATHLAFAHEAELQGINHREGQEKNGEIDDGIGNLQTQADATAGEAVFDGAHGIPEHVDRAALKDTEEDKHEEPENRERHGEISVALEHDGDGEQAVEEGEDREFDEGDAV